MATKQDALKNEIESLLSRIEEMEQRIQQVESTAHSEHSISAEGVEALVSHAVARVLSHLKEKLGLNAAEPSR